MQNGDYLTVALSKGRILEETISIFEQAGLPTEILTEDSRKLVLQDTKNKVSYILGKPMDIPTYVEYGAADLGVVGKDVLMEVGGEYYELLDLKIGHCKMAFARERDKQNVDYSVVASKYPRVTEKYFQKLGRQASIIKLNGSVELAPLINLADLIVDLVSTGKTLEENNLVPIETITDITTRLIANKGSYQIKQDQISKLVKSISQHL